MTVIRAQSIVGSASKMNVFIHPMRFVQGSPVPRTLTVRSLMEWLRACCRRVMLANAGLCESHGMSVFAAMLIRRVTVHFVIHETAAMDFVAMRRGCVMTMTRTRVIAVMMQRPHVDMI